MNLVTPKKIQLSNTTEAVNSGFNYLSANQVQKPMTMISAELWINFIALLIAAVSLIISVISLRISLQVVKYTSREYLPDLDWRIDDDDVLFIKNKSAKLFVIQQVGLIKVDYCGYEDGSKQTVVQIPLVTLSRMRNDFENPSNIVIPSSTAYGCAYVCPYETAGMSFIRDKIDGYRTYDSDKSPLPYLQSVMYLVQVTYKNKFHETKSVYYMKKHFHGSGYHHSVIGEERFQQYLTHIDIPKFDNHERLWKYVIHKYSEPW